MNRTMTSGTCGQAEGGDIKDGGTNTHYLFIVVASVVGYAVSYVPFGCVFAVIAAVVLGILQSKWLPENVGKIDEADETFSTQAKMNKLWPDRDRFFPQHVYHQDTDPGGWLGTIAQSLWPAIKDCVIKTLKDTVEPIIAAKLEEFNVQKYGIVAITFKKIDLGEHAPFFAGLRSNGTQTETMLDMEFTWPAHGAEIIAEIEWKVGGLKSEVILSSVHFDGTIRIGFQDLIHRWPGFGTVNASFLRRPHVDFDLHPFGSYLSDIPIVTDIVINIVRNAIGDAMVWPNQIVVPIISPDDDKDDTHTGILNVRLMRGKDLAAGSNAFAVLSVDDETYTSEVQHNTNAPRWDEAFQFKPKNNGSIMLRIGVKSANTVRSNATLGVAYLDLSNLNDEEQMQREMWCVLNNEYGETAAAQGQVLVHLNWVPEGVEAEPDKLGHSGGGPELDVPMGEGFSLKGVVHMKLIGARNLMNMDTFSKSDPFATIVMGAERRRSSVKQDTLNPRWNESFKFMSCNPKFEIIQLKLYDEDSTSEDFLGNVDIKVSDVQSAEGGRMVNTFSLVNPAKKVTSGEVDVELSWEEIVSETKSAKSAPKKKTKK